MFVLVHKAAKQQQTLPATRQRRHKRTCGWEAGEATVVSRLFEGQLSYMMMCLHCEHQAHSTQAFTILSLPIPRGTQSCSIQVAASLSWIFQLFWRWLRWLVFTTHCSAPCADSHLLRLSSGPLVLYRTACRCSSGTQSSAAESRFCVLSAGWGEKPWSSPLSRNLLTSSYCTWNGGSHGSIATMTMNHWSLLYKSSPLLLELWLRQYSGIDTNTPDTSMRYCYQYWCQYMVWVPILIRV